MIGLPELYAVAGLLFAVFAWLSLRDRRHAQRWGNAAFWGLLALSFLAGHRLGDMINGLVVLLLVALAGTGRLGTGAAASTGAEARQASADRHGNWLLLPALVIPATAVLGTLFLKDSGLVDDK